MASPKTSERIQQLFDRALDLDSPARERFLNEAARDDPEVRQAVERLLAAYSAAESDPAWETSAIQSLTRSATVLTGSSLDHYRLLEQIGAGGMGLVYKAVREDDFSKIVAVKVLLAPDPAASARFRRERQILAGLEHPNIARLLDGGTSPEGAPFLVMEYVDGTPLDRHVRENHLSTQEILTLFRKVCGAIAYAHRKLIVHRDLKPANILVTPDGEPRVLDFGIARIIDGTAARTRTGFDAMTLEYASPEQVRGSVLGTATDVYSLGVTLYELLCGARPYAGAASHIELARAITEGRIERPRPKDGTLDVDLRNILQMAMRLEPERRYGGADQLSEDIRRYQEGYPVLARPNTFHYRARKFARRNRLAIAASFLVAAAIGGGIIATARQASIANRRFHEARAFANSYVFEVHDAIKDLPGATEARRIIITRALDYLDSVARERTNDRPLRRELAATYARIADIQGRPVRNSFGDRPAALASYKKAIAILEPVVAESPNDAAAAEQLALIYEDASAIAGTQADLTLAVDYCRKGIALMTRLTAARHGDAKLQNALASVYIGLGDNSGNPSSPASLGDTKTALESYEKAAAIWEKLSAESPADLDKLMLVAIAATREAMILEAMADAPGAVKAYRRTLEIDERLFRARPADTRFLSDTAVANRNLAKALLRVNETAEAAPLAARSLQLYQQIASADPNNFESHTALGIGYAIAGRVQQQMGQLGPAVRNYECAIAIFEKAESDRPQSLPPLELRNLYELMADISLRRGAPDRALDLGRRQLAFVSRFLAVNPSNVVALRNQGVADRQIGLAHEAIAIRGPRSRRVAELEQALPFLRAAAETASALQAKGQLPPIYASDIRMAAEALARVERDLKQTGAYSLLQPTARLE